MIKIKYINIIKNYLKLNVEVCGNFILDDNELILDDIPRIGEKDELGRNMCITDNINYNYHTHPNGQKWYPSLEDIYKVKKHKIVSFIFCEYGIWELFYFSNKTFNKEKINKILNSFYWDTGKGRKFCTEDTCYDIYSLIEMFSNNICENSGVKLNFTRYNYIEKYYVIKKSSSYSKKTKRSSSPKKTKRSSSSSNSLSPKNKKFKIL